VLISGSTSGSISANLVYRHLALLIVMVSVYPNNSISKGKAVPLQAWSSPVGSRKFRFPDFMTTAQDDDKVVSLMHWPPLPPGNIPGTHFC